MINVFENLFFSGLLLIQLLPFFFGQILFNTYTLAKGIFVFVFFYNVFFNKKLNKIFQKHKTIISLFAFYFISQSISIVYVLNIEDFIRKYQNFLFSSVIFLLLLIYIKNRSSILKVIYILIFVFLIDFLFQILIYIYPFLFIQLGNTFLHPAAMSLITYKIQMGQVYIESYDEILIPIIIYFLSQNKLSKHKVFFIFSFFTITFLSFVASIRTKFLMFIFSVIGSLALFIKILKKHLVLLTTAVSIFIFLIYKLQISSFGFTTIERLLLEDPIQDYSTIVTRIDRWKKALEIGSSSPIVGIGMGNYYDYLNWRHQRTFTSSVINSQSDIQQTMAKDPLNIFFTTFGETGSLGLFSLLLLIFYFIKKDIELLRQDEPFTKSFVISFWTLFIFAILNPAYSIKYQALWWVLRIVIEKLSVKPNMYK